MSRTSEKQATTDIFEGYEAEQAVLGSLLIDRHAIIGIGDMLDPSDFLGRKHQVIYAAMLRLRDAAKPTDINLVCAELNGDLDAAGGAGYVASLTLPSVTPTSMNAAHYAGQVREAARKRLLIEMGQRMAQGIADTDAAIAKAEDVLREARDRKPAQSWEPKAACLSRLYDRITGPSTADDTGIVTGLGSLDWLIRGMRRGDLVIVGARPRIGKTSLAVTVSHHVALKLGKPVAFFSLEMLRDRIWEKLVCIETRIPWNRLTSHDLQSHEDGAIAGAVGRIAESSIDIVPAREWTVDQLRATAREMHRKQPLALIVVDYLQLLRVDGWKDNRVQQVTAISAGLKAMAMELECPVLAAAQLNRELEYHKGAEPKLADLRESGSIENDADTIILLHREPPDPQAARSDRYAPAAELQAVTTIVAKNRMGSEGKVQLMLHGPQMRFYCQTQEREFGSRAAE